MWDTSSVEVNNSVRVFTFVPDNLGALTVSARRVENWWLACLYYEYWVAHLIGHLVIYVCVWTRSQEGQS